MLSNNQKVGITYYMDVIETVLGKNSKRYLHSIDVYKLSKRVATYLNEDVYKASVAALLHDVTKYFSYDEHVELIVNEELLLLYKDYEPTLHGISASFYIQEKLGIEDIEIIDAVRYHVTGKKNMSLLSKIIFVCDYATHDIKPCIEVRELLLDEKFDDAFRLCLEYNKEYFEKNNIKCHINFTEMYNGIMNND